MRAIRLEGGPFGGLEGPLDTAWLPSWVGVRRDPRGGPNGMLVSPGHRSGGELYVLVDESDVAVFHHWTIGAGLDWSEVTAHVAD